MEQSAGAPDKMKHGGKMYHGDSAPMMDHGIFPDGAMPPGPDKMDRSTSDKMEQSQEKSIPGHTWNVEGAFDIKSDKI